MINEINKICTTLSEPTLKEKVKSLTEIIISSCNINASIFCTECIKTLPAQSEIIISFSVSGIKYSKVIDIVSGSRLEFGGMHDLKKDPFKTSLFSDENV